jgi:APA family basic amino acid/polyamine antiporter
MPQETSNSKLYVLIVILSIAIVVLAAGLYAFVAVGLVGYHELAVSGSPLADAAQSESKNAAILISIGALVATLSVLLTTLLGLSRISFAMARNHDLPAFFAKLHPKRATPYNTILVFGLVMTIFAAFTDLLRAAAISNFASLLYYAIANYAALKIEKPVYPRIIPVLGLITCVMLLFFLARDAWIIGGLALLSGIVFYHMEKSETIRWKI